MLIDQEECEKRLNNPLNLMNKMRNGFNVGKKNAMDLFVRSKEAVEVEIEKKSVIPFKNPFQQSSLVVSSIPSIPSISTTENPKAEDLIDDSDSKIKLALAHDSALELLTTGLERLNNGMKSGNIEEKKIPAILTATSKIITDIRKERLEREKNNKGDANVHYHFYCPEQRKIDTYEVIEVTG